MREAPSYYAIIPANVRYDKRLNANAKLLYGEITALASKTGQCWAGDTYFSELYDVSQRTIQRWLLDLEKAGYIKREVTYKKGTKEIDKRYITMEPTLQTKMSVPPTDENVRTLQTKTSEPYRQKCQDPTDKNVRDSTTSTSTTRISNTVNKDISALFNEFWEIYPNKKNKKRAQTTYNNNINKETHEIILKDIKQRIETKEWKDVRYIPHPTTYLNGERWNDLLDTELQEQDLRNYNAMETIKPEPANDADFDWETFSKNYDKQKEKENGR